MDQAYCDALRFAFDYEKIGEEHYRKTAAKVRNKFAKQALTFLADEEIEHIRKIDEFNLHLLGQSDFDIDSECRMSLPERVEAFLEEARDAGRLDEKYDISDIDVYNQAMANEKEGFEMYAEAENSSDEQSLKRFFAFLAHEEQAHYRLLAASKKYLEDPSYYFEEGGGWLFG